MKKISICIVMLIGVIAVLYSQTFTDYANKMRQEIQELKDINSQREQTINSQKEKISMQEDIIDQSNKKVEEAIKESEEACNALIKQAEQIKRQNKLLRIALIVLIVKIVGSVLLLVIKYKYKIEIPYWLNVIL